MISLMGADTSEIDFFTFSGRKADMNATGGECQKQRKQYASP